MTKLDAYLQRFQNLPNFNIYSVGPDGLTVLPWWEVSMEALIPELVIDELGDMTQAGVVTADIQKWGRLSAQTRRVWEIEERKLRSWKAGFFLNCLTDAEAAGEKKPTQATIEALYRDHVDYSKHYAAVERAEEACNATERVLEAFRAKKDMLTRFVRRYRENDMA